MATALQKVESVEKLCGRTKSSNSLAKTGGGAGGGYQGGGNCSMANSGLVTLHKVLETHGHVITGHPVLTFCVTSCFCVLLMISRPSLENWLDELGDAPRYVNQYKKQENPRELYLQNPLNSIFVSFLIFCNFIEYLPKYRFYLLVLVST